MKADWISLFKLVMVAIGGFLGGLLGGWDIMLEVLLTCVVIDLATGIAKALMGKSDKAENGGLSSGAIFKGGMRKILIFSVVAVAVVADKIISPDSTLIRSGAIAYYIGSEGLSIVENVTLCGLPIPKKLREILESLKSSKEED